MLENKKDWLLLLMIECEAVAVEFEQSFVAHFRELGAHGAAVNGEIVGELLAIEGDGKACGPGAHAFGGEIAGELGAGGAGGEQAELLHEDAIFVGEHVEQILHDEAVEGAGVGADGEHAPRLEECDDAVADADDICQHGPAGGRNVGFAEEIPWREVGDDGVVAPVIVALDVQLSFEHDGDLRKLLALTENGFAFFVGASLSLQTVEHTGDVVGIDAAKERGLLQLKQMIFFHGISFLVGNTTASLSPSYYTGTRKSRTGSENDRGE